MDPIPRVWRCSQTGLEIQPRPQSASGSEPSCRGWTTAAFNSFDNAHLGLDMDPFSKRALQSPVRNPLARSNYPHDSPLALSRLQITRRRFQARKKSFIHQMSKGGIYTQGKTRQRHQTRFCPSQIPGQATKPSVRSTSTRKSALGIDRPLMGAENWPGVQLMIFLDGRHRIRRFVDRPSI